MWPPAAWVPPFSLQHGQGSPNKGEETEAIQGHISNSMSRSALLALDNFLFSYLCIFLSSLTRIHFYKYQVPITQPPPHTHTLPHNLVLFFFSKTPISSIYCLVYIFRYLIKIFKWFLFLLFGSPFFPTGWEGSGQVSSVSTNSTNKQRYYDIRSLGVKWEYFLKKKQTNEFSTSYFTV